MKTRDSRYPPSSGMVEDKHILGLCEGLYTYLAYEKSSLSCWDVGSVGQLLFLLGPNTLTV